MTPRPDLTGKHFAIWGLAFKPLMLKIADDMREAPSRVVVAQLLQRGATLSAYDPVAMPEAQRVLADMPGLSFAPDQSAALEGADALLAAAEWKEFRNPDFDAMRVALRRPVVFDGRNIYDPAVMKLHGLEYFGIGRGVRVAGVVKD